MILITSINYEKFRFAIWVAIVCVSLGFGSNFKPEWDSSVIDSMKFYVHFTNQYKSNKTTVIFFPGSHKSAKDYFWLSDDRYNSVVLELYEYLGDMFSWNMTFFLNVFCLRWNITSTNILVCGHSLGSMMATTKVLQGYTSHGLLNFGYVPPEANLVYNGHSNVPVVFVTGTNDCDIVKQNIFFALYYWKSEFKQNVFIQFANHAGWAYGNNKTDVCLSMSEKKQQAIAKDIIVLFVNFLNHMDWNSVCRWHQNSHVKFCNCCSESNHSWRHDYCAKVKG
jgi:predicted esterase